MTAKEVENYVINSKAAVYGISINGDWDLLYIADILDYLYNTSKDYVWLSHNEDVHELKVPIYVLSNAMMSFINGESTERFPYVISGRKGVQGDEYYHMLYIEFLSFDEYKKIK